MRTAEQPQMRQVIRLSAAVSEHPVQKGHRSLHSELHVQKLHVADGHQAATELQQPDSSNTKLQQLVRLLQQSAPEKMACLILQQVRGYVGFVVWIRLPPLPSSAPW